MCDGKQGALLRLWLDTFSPQSCSPHHDYIAPSTHFVLGYPFGGESTYITTSPSTPENGRYRENAFTARVAVKAHQG
jgi:hypothetical protein